MAAPGKPTDDAASRGIETVPQQVIRQLVGDAKRVVIKVGSQVLCQADGQVDEQVLARLCTEICGLMAAGRQVVLVSSGAVAMGRGEVGQAVGAADKGIGLLGKQSLAAIGQALLMSRYRQYLGAHGVHTAQLLLTHDDLGERSRFLHARRVTLELLDAGILPVVNENDTVSVKELRFGDNDALAAQMAQTIAADVLILLTEVDGLFTADPHIHPDAVKLDAVRSRDDSVLAIAGEGTSAFGTGGMRSKVMAARNAGEVGVPTVVAHGRRPGVLARVLAGELEGTVFVPTTRKLSARRKWLAANPRTRGQVDVDAGAAHALRVGGRSLLPVGVTGVSGRFGVGDAIRIVGPDGAVLGRGLARYTSEDAKMAAGLRTAQVAEKLGWLPAKELVHRDDFVS
ncbi:MAG: glutamate 5-kinase [Myxococcales bacterium]|nr:glutamate 5-kinase [Myxococcales bacterium]